LPFKVLPTLFSELSGGKDLLICLLLVIEGEEQCVNVKPAKVLSTVIASYSWELVLLFLAVGDRDLGLDELLVPKVWAVPVRGLYQVKHSAGS
jgi:hypothetical protein